MTPSAASAVPVLAPCAYISWSGVPGKGLSNEEGVREDHQHQHQGGALFA